MGKYIGPACKLCRREGQKLFLKGDRCYTAKCAVVKRKYPPGVHGPKRRSRLSGYGQQLREKQKAKRIYNISENTLENYYEKANQQGGDSSVNLLKLLEMRFDNVVYRLGFAKSRRLTRQMINHGHFLVNGKKMNIPSYQVKIGDVITIKDNKKDKALFKDIAKKFEKQELPGWLSFDKDSLSAKVLSEPQAADFFEPIDVTLIIEFYSR